MINVKLYKLKIPALTEVFRFNPGLVEIHDIGQS